MSLSLEQWQAMAHSFNADQEEVERRGRESWANAIISARPESPLRLTMSLGNEVEVGGTGTEKEITRSDIISNHSTNDSDMIGLADGTSAAAAAVVTSTSDDADKNDNNRKRKEIVLGHSNSHQVLGNCIPLTDAKNATMPKKLKKTEAEDNINVVAPTADSDTPPDSISSTQLTTGRGSVCTVASVETSSLSLHQSSVTTSGQKKQKEAKGEKNTVMHHFRHHEQHHHRHLHHHHHRHHHVGHVSSVRKNISANDHSQQRMLNPDIIHTITTAMMTKRNEIMLSKEEEEEEEDKEEEDAQDTAHPTKRWPITLAMVTPLLVVVMSTSFILVAPSTATAQHLPPLLLLLSLAILITLLPIFGLVLLPPMPTTTSMTAAAASTADPIINNNNNNNTPPTLREFLSHPEGFHMSFAPAFFGFFAYFGCLTALEEMTNGRIVPKPTTATTTTAATISTATTATSNTSETTTTTTTTTTASCCGLQSVSGASAGAMAAVMLAAGIQPRIAAQFASTFTWKMIADPPGWGGYVRGNSFEEVMRKFLLEAGTRNTTIGSCPLTATTNHNNDRAIALAKPIQLEEALVPVAVSAFDILRMKGMNLTRGCMAKAARCSAGFPGLFQPVAWRAERNEDIKASLLPDSLLIDGGITDHLGLNGLCETTTSTEKKTKRVINMMVGDFGFRGPRGLDTLPPGVNAEYLVSIAIIGTPLCGPWAMQNGPRAVESSRKAMASILDLPMERGTCDYHYVIRVDASKWLE